MELILWLMPSVKPLFEKIHCVQCQKGDWWSASYPFLVIEWSQSDLYCHHPRTISFFFFLSLITESIPCSEDYTSHTPYLAGRLYKPIKSGVWQWKRKIGFIWRTWWCKELACHRLDWLVKLWLDVHLQCGPWSGVQLGVEWSACPCSGVGINDPLLYLSGLFFSWHCVNYLSEACHYSCASWQKRQGNRCSIRPKAAST